MSQTASNVGVLSISTELRPARVHTRASLGVSNKWTKQMWTALQPENMKIKFWPGENSKTIKEVKQSNIDILYSHRA